MIQLPKIIRVMIGRGAFLSKCSVFSGVSSHHNFIVNSNGELFGVGENSHGQLGIGDIKGRVKPVAVSFFSESGRFLSSIACGYQHTLALTTKGEVFSCGWNDDGQLGHGDKDTRYEFSRIQFFSNIRVIEITCGVHSSYCLTFDGIVYSFGWNISGQLGDGTLYSRTSPVRLALPNAIRIARITAGPLHAAALAEDGTVYTFGSNISRQLCRRADNCTPMKAVGLPNDRKVEQVLCGEDFTVFVYNENEILAVGSNRNGELGIGMAVQQSEPVKVEWFAEHGMKKMSCGGGHTICQLISGDIVVYGKNDFKQLCMGDDFDRIVPTFATLKEFRGSKVADFACGNRHTLMVTQKLECFVIGLLAPDLYKRRGERPLCLLKSVRMGSPDGSDTISRALLLYIAQEQNLNNFEGKTTDFELIVHGNSSRRVLMVNKAFLAARCDKIFNSDDIVTQGDVGDVGDQILNYLYADECNNMDAAVVLESLVGGLRDTLLGSMLQLFGKRDKDGDVKIISQDGFVFMAHKFVLVARTSYFRRLFRGKWSESATNTVRLEMTLNGTFKKYLKYLYTGERTSSDPEDPDDPVEEATFDEYQDYFGDGE